MTGEAAVPDRVKRHAVYTTAMSEGWAVGDVEVEPTVPGRRLVSIRIQDGDDHPLTGYRGVLYFVVPARGRVVFSGLLIFRPLAGSVSRGRGDVRGAQAALAVHRSTITAPEGSYFRST